MKKLFCLVLVAALFTGMAAPALAADAADARLSAVTLKVKETLGLDTDAYESFYGNFYEDALSPVWNLGWSNKESSLTIEADENGGIISYYLYDKTATYKSAPFLPAFPKGNETSARAAAAAFLAKVLDASLESVVLTPDTNNSLDATQLRYSGYILLNGLPSPLSYSVSVRAEDNVILRYYRDSLSTKYLGDVPSAKPSATASTAGALLKPTLALRLEYVLPDDGKRAVLRYLPESVDEYYVDAQTGKLVNLTALYEDVSARGEYGFGGDSGSSAAASDESSVKLTDAEQAGVTKLEGVLAKEALDAKLQALLPLGLSSYTLASASYWVDESTGEVSCRLQYTKQVDGDLWRRYVTVDGKTGALQSVYSSIPWSETAEETQPKVDAAAAQTLAEGFLSQYYATDYVRLTLYTGNDVSIYRYSPSHSFHYAQKENGCFYAGNYYSISIDGTDGSVSDFNYHFDREVTFDSMDGILSMEAAVEAYFDTYTVKLGYLAVPVKLDPTAPEWKPLIARGYSYLYSLSLAYALEREDYVSGIDAKTGKPVLHSYTETAALTYDDMAGHWAQTQAEKLAQYNVGWRGGSFSPAQTLTQFDLLCLLVSTEGHLYNPEKTDESAVNNVYDLSYSMGLLTSAERSDNALVTRGELVKLILNAGGYGEVAKLPGIFRCAYADERYIPAQYYGYAALAQGLGIVSGDSGGSFASARIATRAEAAVMLYNLMSKK